MSDPQDRAEALDDDKGPFPLEDDSGIDVLDNTADADPGVADEGRAVIDGGDSGDDLDGSEAEPDAEPDPFHVEPVAPEVAAMHRTAPK